MKNLLLVRHAKSSWKDAALPDFERPLNKRGKKDAPFMGKLLKKMGVKPDLIISSPAKRALRTAEILVEENGIPEKKLLFEKDLYMAGEEELLKIVNGLDDNLNTVMIIGHNPGLTDFCNLLSGEFIDNIPTAGIVSLKYNEEKWADLRSGCCSIGFFEYPKKYSTGGEK